ncbi:hypothetical protein CRG98_026855 [Punica granatum]|uniref:Uncharacterized protein n=1 Tax=Punica granatum TaxID=22663 RepID=A0A2I0JA87_PUNGR|nr:hypothetical protein CRG98_026855 [Punica granatum]
MVYFSGCFFIFAIKAYVLQEQGNLLELVDPSLGSNYSEEEAMRMLNLALLCTNPSPTLRPPMSSVVSMLEGKIAIQAPLVKRNTMNPDPRFRAFERLSRDSQTNVSLFSQDSQQVPGSMSMEGPWVDSSVSLPTTNTSDLFTLPTKLIHRSIMFLLLTLQNHGRCENASCFWISGLCKATVVSIGNLIKGNLNSPENLLGLVFLNLRLFHALWVAFFGIRDGRFCIEALGRETDLLPIAISRQDLSIDCIHVVLLSMPESEYNQKLAAALCFFPFLTFSVKDHFVLRIKPLPIELARVTSVFEKS